MSRLISIVVPAFNKAPFIAAAIESAQTQTYSCIEIIVVDDGSTDGTAEIVSKFVQTDPRIKLLRQPNLGVANARNRAIKESRGEFIAPLDADDIWRPTKLERQLSVFDSSGPDLALVYTWTHDLDWQGNLIPGRVQRYSIEGFVFDALLETNVVGPSSVPLIRRDCIKSVGGYDPTLRQAGAEGCEDWKLYLALAERWTFAVVPFILVGYRIVPGNMSTNHRQMAKSRELVLEWIFRRHGELSVRQYRRALGQSRFCYFRNSAESLDLFTALRLTLRADPFLPVRSWFLMSIGNWLWNFTRDCLLGLLFPGKYKNIIIERDRIKSTSFSAVTKEMIPDIM